MKGKRFKYYILLIFFWTFLIGGLLIYQFNNISKETDRIIRTEAIANFNKDKAIRFWAAEHGGVYVPIDSITPPNPALSHLPERDIKTPSGKQLTLMNPAYMIRQLNEYFAEYYGIVGHITSEKLLRPENKPDDWEQNALKQFEKGVKSISGYSDINGEPYFRLMQPMVTKSTCLKCHGHQGYKVGDVRGGVGIAIPLKEKYLFEKKVKKQNAVTFIILWFLGLIGITFGYKKVNSSMKRKEEVQEALIVQNNELISTKKDLLIKNNEYQAVNEELTATTDALRMTNQELTEAKTKAEESDRLKTEFINNMSHEIRTPMNGILGFANFLNKPELSDEKRSFYTSIIKNSGVQLMRIIDDILEISKLNTKQVQVNEETVCLNDLITEQFLIFDIKANETNLPIYLNKTLSDETSTIFTDRVKLNKVLSNLIENALKFTTKGYVEIGYVLKSENEATWLEIYVKDTGVGIKPEKKESIFQRFSQEETDLSKKAGGLGLGLAIAKENTELLGGKISVESKKGEGAKFIVNIPYKPTKGNDNKQFFLDNDLKEVHDEYTFLIVEDEEVSFLFIETILVELYEEKCKVIHARNGKEAVNYIQADNEIDIVFMDLKMPEMNGFDAAKEIRKLNKEIPIIAQTAYTSDKDKKKAIMAGCNELITKPIDETQMKKIIACYLKI